MLGFSYMSVRGTDLPLWFVILVAVLVVGAAVFVFADVFLSELSKRRKERKNSTTEKTGKNEKALYMGKDRLMKILFHYILGRYGEIIHKDIVSVIREYEAENFYEQERHPEGAFYTYDRISTPGCNEWIFCCCTCVGHNFDIEVCGAAVKQVTIKDRYDVGNLPCSDAFFTFYDENFIPKANETLLRGNTAQTSGLDTIKPFTDENTTYKGIDRDFCVCYDIAKTK